MLCSSVADPWIEHGVEQVDDQVHDNVGEAEHQHDALDDRIVAAQDGVHDEAANAGDGEHAFGHHGAANQPGEADADDGDDKMTKGLLREGKELNLKNIDIKFNTNLGEKNERRVAIYRSFVDHCILDSGYRNGISFNILYPQVWLEPSLVLYIDVSHSFNWKRKIKACTFVKRYWIH